MLSLFVRSCFIVQTWSTILETLLLPDGPATLSPKVLSALYAKVASRSPEQAEAIKAAKAAGSGSKQYLGANLPPFNLLHLHLNNLLNSLIRPSKLPNSLRRKRPVNLRHLCLLVLRRMQSRSVSTRGSITRGVIGTVIVSVLRRGTVIVLAIVIMITLVRASVTA